MEKLDAITEAPLLARGQNDITLNSPTGTISREIISNHGGSSKNSKAILRGNVRACAQS
jgi:hypothetical protein